MRTREIEFKASDKKPIFLLRFDPDEAKPKAIVHVSHGMAEHGARYARFAEALTKAGYVVFANDHRGHGKTAKGPEELGQFGAEEAGFGRVASDLIELIAFEKRELAGETGGKVLPFFLFGHSMGSYLAQDVAIERSNELTGLVLSGTSGSPGALGAVGRVVARAERMRVGPRGESGLLRAMTFDAFNKQFKPNRTSFDWLSRDEAEVDKYVADPLSGFTIPTQLWVDVLDGLGAIARPERQARIRKDLPVYVFAGAEDPVGENGKSVQRLLDAYAKAGLTSVEHRLYPGARHETLNETNRDEVTADVLAWLARHV